MAPFPSKLKEISSEYPEVVCWDHSLQALIIRDPHRLQNEIMPKWFNTNGTGVLKSFTRQLNYYGFHRVSYEKDNTMKPLVKITNDGSHPTLISSRRQKMTPSVTIDQEDELLLLLRLRDSDNTDKISQRRFSMDSTASSSSSSNVEDIFSVYGIDALIFVNKDPTINSIYDFARLVRCEKAADRQPPPGLDLSFRRNTKTRCIRPPGISLHEQQHMNNITTHNFIFDDNAPTPKNHNLQPSQ
eukprot:CAMPEP_0197289720 /NCGR_PEP_ID=MMETSP0890-20130614/6986_1 /TAXON_ID=44058 ORGANISM="Aureoumbra lagunensis, Strain CCMP1510" /NCGR_SAMPLE_ID=MMETSP0890 /ASSEMBLY_ACC=CAM_ASM_000533 /LENGTH=242 /DNA_ID=CAMNT_0042761299 /DNA_START=146 /DNA_END=874 /DNA_ORIENTATION=-